MKKIIFVIGGLTRGGGERVVSNLANNYVKLGIEVEIITLLTDEVNYNLSDEIQITCLSSEKPRILQVFTWVREIRKKTKKDMEVRVVSFFSHINVLSIFATLGLDNRLVISERNDPENDGRSIFIKILTKIFYPKADVIVFQSEWAKSKFNRRIQQKSVILPNPVSVNALKSKTTKKVIAVGRLAEQKNYPLLFRIFKIVNKSLPDYQLHIYGEGHLLEELKNDVKTLNLEQNISFEGNIENIHEEISDAKLFIQTSKFEGQSNALLECMMIGIPVAVANYPSIEEVITDGKDGIILSGDIEENANVIIDALNDNKYLESISKRAIKTAQKYELEKVVKEWSNVIE